MKSPKQKKKVVNLPKIKDAVAFRLEQYGHTQAEACRIMKISCQHFNEVLSGKRKPSLSQTKALFHYGIPGTVLLQ